MNETQEKKQDTELMQLVTFNSDQEEFGVDILKVQEIIRMMEITKVPKSPEFVEGVINLRGKVIPIIDLRKRFGVESRAHDKDTRIIVNRHQLHDRGVRGGCSPRRSCAFPRTPWSRPRRWWPTLSPTTSREWANCRTGC